MKRKYLCIMLWALSFQAFANETDIVYLEAQTPRPISEIDLEAQTPAFGFEVSRATGNKSLRCGKCLCDYKHAFFIVGATVVGGGIYTCWHFLMKENGI